MNARQFFFFFLFNVALQVHAGDGPFQAYLDNMTPEERAEREAPVARAISEQGSSSFSHRGDKRLRSPEPKMSEALVVAEIEVDTACEWVVRAVNAVVQNYLKSNEVQGYLGRPDLSESRQLKIGICIFDDGEDVVVQAISDVGARRRFDSRSFDGMLINDQPRDFCREFLEGSGRHRPPSPETYWDRY